MVAPSHDDELARRADEDLALMVERACRLVGRGELVAAGEVVRTQYPHVSSPCVGRKATLREATQLFVRDGFVDRYRGGRLVFPGALRVLSLRLPEAMPYHPNGKMDRSHPAWWELFPTIDHVVPIARGGANDPSNWVTCSMTTNSIKANWTLEQLGWRLRELGAIERWDGLLGWFVEMVAEDRTLLTHDYVRRWHAAASGFHRASR